MTGRNFVEQQGREGCSGVPGARRTTLSPGDWRWSPDPEVHVVSRGWGPCFYPSAHRWLPRSRPSLPPVSPPSLLPLSLGAGAASQPNPKPSSHLFRAGNERRGKQAQPSNPLTARFLLSLLKWALGSQQRTLQRAPECLIETAPAQAHPQQAQARAPNSRDLSHRHQKSHLQHQAGATGSES